ncbi:MAG: ankyrin repeat and protein 1 isoform [Francisellaceae bacterium]|nr:ankyrin repeat and protein 1 isoform [Francisellaceae bacterium]
MKIELVIALNNKNYEAIKNHLYKITNHLELKEVILQLYFIGLSTSDKSLIDFLQPYLYINSLKMNRFEMFNHFLILSATENQPKMVKYFLAQDANPNDDRNTYNLTALVLACQQNNLDIVKELLPKCDKNNISFALMKSCSEKNIDVEIIFALIKTDADVKKIFDNGSTALLRACENNHVEVVKLLLDKGADINSVEDYTVATPNGGWIRKNNTPLSFAMFTNYGDHVENLPGAVNQENINASKILDLLLNHPNLDVNYVYKGDSITALSRAIINNKSIPLIKALIAKGAKINYYGRPEYSVLSIPVNPLMIAIEKRNKEIVELLVQKGAEVNHIYNNRFYLREDRLSIYSSEFVSFPLGSTINSPTKREKVYYDLESATPLMLACHLPEIVDILLKNGADCNLSNLEGITALFQAACQGHYESAKLLLNKGANINQLDPSSGGITPLMAATQYNQTQLVKLFLERQADLNLKDSGGFTALMIAICYGNKESAILLLNANADVTLLDEEGDSALSLTQYEEPDNDDDEIDPINWDNRAALQPIILAELHLQEAHYKSMDLCKKVIKEFMKMNYQTLAKQNKPELIKQLFLKYAPNISLEDIENRLYPLHFKMREWVSVTN